MAWAAIIAATIAFPNVMLVLFIAMLIFIIMYESGDLHRIRRRRRRRRR